MIGHLYLTTPLLRLLPTSATSVCIERRVESDEGEIRDATRREGHEKIGQGRTGSTDRGREQKRKASGGGHEKSPLWNSTASSTKTT